MDIRILLAKLLSSAIKDIISNNLRESKPRKEFSKATKRMILAIQLYRCNHCGRFLDVINFDHIDGNRSNNVITNCQALCPNCHAITHRKKG